MLMKIHTLFLAVQDKYFLRISFMSKVALVLCY